LILSHTFTFQTEASLDSTKTLENIIAITEEDEKKHFIQYIQYELLSEESIALRYVNIKVDRPYYLEMANINISNQNRRRYLFSVLGKRRFGANNKLIDYYLHNLALKEDILDEEYKKLSIQSKFIAKHSQKSEYSTNEYKVFRMPLHDSTIYYLDQVNITQRKRIYKTFCVELYTYESKIFDTLESDKKKIEYLFNKIGKIHFKFLEPMQLKTSRKYPTPHDLALSKLVKSSFEMEATSRINDNLVFRKLKERSEDIGRVDTNLSRAYLALLNNPTSQDVKEDFYDATDIYIEYIDEITQLEEIKKHFLDLKALVSAGSIPYLVTKKDNDLKDIFLYMLESFTLWNTYLHDNKDDVKAFNVATIDFKGSLRHLVDICYKFKHEYKCHDVELSQETSEYVVEDTQTITQPQKSIESMQEQAITSAEKFFLEMELEPEIYDELHELDMEIELLQYSQTWNSELQESLIKFFEGYTRVLNPLFEFKDLSYSLMLLSQKLQEYKENENAEMLLSLIKYLIHDLLEWKRTVLLDKTADDIHYMDKSFYSNIAQIELSIEQREVDDDCGDIEFF